MRKILLLLLLVVVTAPALADQYVNGHIRRDGTYVDGYYRTAPNSYKFDNYSTQGNTNPYTGQRGYTPNELSQPNPSRSPYSPSPYGYRRR